MMMFLLFAGMLLLASIAIVLWPLWRGGVSDGSRREANVAVFEQHTAEVERELAAGGITPEQAQTRRDELSVRLLADVDATADAHARAHTPKRPWLASTLVIAGFVALAVGLYGWLGDTRGLHLDQRPDIATLVAKMKARVEAVPGDVRTRALLAQVQMTQHKYAAAAQSLSAINARLDTPDATFLLAEARARVLDHKGVVTTKAQALYAQVLELKPNNAEALWFAGLAALADGHKQTAIQYWQRLSQQDISSDFHERVQQRLAELQGDTPDLVLGDG